MIVKNEKKAIQRCLESVKPLIDYWVIVDTGSTDGTQQIIKDVLKDVPGELYERPWKNFEHNRNEALDYAKGKGDYLLFIDADEEFVYEPMFNLKNLDEDAYYILVYNDVDGKAVSRYARKLVVNNCLNWSWKGVIHEDIFSSEEKSTNLLQGICNISRTHDGARGQDPLKYEKDIQILLQALEEDPTNARYWLHLGLSYDLSNSLENAIEAFQKTLSLLADRKEFCTEADVALFIMTELMVRQNYPTDAIMQAAQNSFLYNPRRAEPLFYLACHMMTKQNWLIAELLLRKVLTIEEPQLAGFVLTSVYQWEAEYYLLQCCFNLGKYQEVRTIMEKILKNPYLPVEVFYDIKNHQDHINQLASDYAHN